MIKIGITGGIGCGKSTVAALFRIMGCSVYTADDETKRLENRSTLLRTRLTELVGDELYNNERLLNKAMLASYIFGNEAHLKAVNAIIHPLVKQDFIQWTARQTSPICLLESAILFESGFEDIVDRTIFVDAPLETRMERIMGRDHTTREKILLRMNSQMDEQEKRLRCDFVIVNDDRLPLIPQVQQLLAKLPV